jgi:hypothetical protein
MCGLAGIAVALLTISASAVLTRTPRLPTIAPPTHDIASENRVPVAMRDGLVLEAAAWGCS